MIEQCIYGRARESVVKRNGERVTLGYGNLAVSEGYSSISDRMEQMLGEYPAGLLDARQNAPRILYKYALKRNENQTLHVLQQASRVRVGYERAYCLWHQHIATDAESALEMMQYPLDWMSVHYQSEEADWREIQVYASEYLDVSEDYPMSTLSKLTAFFGMTTDSLEQLLCCLLEAADTGSRRVVIAFDDTKSDYEMHIRQLLVFIYMLLPVSVRLRLGFETWMTGRLEPSVCQLSFASRRYVHQDGGRICVDVNRIGAGMEVRTTSIDITDGYLLYDGRLYTGVGTLPGNEAYLEFIRLWLPAIMRDDTCFDAFTQLNEEYWIPFEGVPAGRTLDYRSLVSLFQMREGLFECKWEQLPSFCSGFLPSMGELGDEALSRVIPSLPGSEDAMADSLAEILNLAADYPQIRQAAAGRLSGYFDSRPIRAEQIGAVVYMAEQGLLHVDDSMWLLALGDLKKGNLKNVGEALRLARGCGSTAVIPDDIRRKALDMACSLLPEEMGWLDYRDDLLLHAQKLDEDQRDAFTAAAVSRMARQRVDMDIEIMAELSGTAPGSLTRRALTDRLKAWNGAELKYDEVLALAQAGEAERLLPEMAGQIADIVGQHISLGAIEPEKLAQMSRLIRMLRSEFRGKCFRAMVSSASAEHIGYFSALRDCAVQAESEPESAECLNATLCRALNALAPDMDALHAIGDIVRHMGKGYFSETLNQAIARIPQNNLVVRSFLKWSRSVSREEETLERLLRDAAQTVHTEDEIEQWTLLFLDEGMEVAAARYIGAAAVSERGFSEERLVQWCSRAAISPICVTALADRFRAQAGEWSLSAGGMDLLMEAARNGRLNWNEADFAPLSDRLEINGNEFVRELMSVVRMLQWMAGEQKERLLNRVDALKERLNYALRDIDEWWNSNPEPGDGEWKSVLRVFLNGLKPANEEERDRYVRGMLRNYGQVAPECVVRMLDGGKCVKDFFSLLREIRTEAAEEQQDCLIVSAIRAMQTVARNIAMDMLSLIDVLAGGEFRREAALEKADELISQLDMSELLRCERQLKQADIVQSVRRQIREILLREELEEIRLSGGAVLDAYESVPLWYPEEADAVVRMRRRLLEVLQTDDERIIFRAAPHLEDAGSEEARPKLIEALVRCLQTTSLKTDCLSAGQISQYIRKLNEIRDIFRKNAPSLILPWLRCLAKSEIVCSEEYMGENAQWLNELLADETTSDAAKECFIMNIMSRLQRSVEEKKAISFKRLLGMAKWIDDEECRFAVLAECMATRMKPEWFDMLTCDLRNHWYESVQAQQRTDEDGKTRRQDRNRETIRMLIALSRAGKAEEAATLMGLSVFVKRPKVIYDLLEQLEREQLCGEEELRPLLERMLCCKALERLFAQQEAGRPDPLFKGKGASETAVQERLLENKKALIYREWAEHLKVYGDLFVAHLRTRVELTARIFMYGMMKSGGFGFTDKKIKDELKISKGGEIISAWKSACRDDESAKLGFKAMCGEYKRVFEKDEIQSINLFCPVLQFIPPEWRNVEADSQDVQIGILSICILREMNHSETDVSVRNQITDWFSPDCWKAISEKYSQAGAVAVRFMTEYLRRILNNPARREKGLVYLRSTIRYILELKDVNGAMKMLELCKTHDVRQVGPILLAWREQEGNAYEMREMTECIDGLMAGWYHNTRSVPAGFLTEVKQYVQKFGE